jgi:peptide-methionine (R)-S-oxide reductase
MPSRRTFLLRSAAGAGAALGAGTLGRRALAATAAFEVTHTEAQWRKLLSDAQFQVLRQGGTERAFSSPLNKEHRSGRFACAGCQLELFSSRTKFDSGTGWPSFWAPLEHAVVANPDRSFGMLRTEVLCRRCGGHLGHVFDDGPRPTGLRYCINGVAMNFKPGAA